MPYQLIAFDLDGTLLDSAKRIRPESLAAIEKAAAAGKTVVLATGRCIPELSAYLEQLKNVKYTICISGAAVFETASGVPVFSKEIEPELVEELLRRSEGENVMVHLLSRRSIVEKGFECHMADYNMGVYQEMFDRLTEKPEDLRRFYREQHPVVNKLNFYCRTHAQRSRLEERLSDLPLTHCYAETHSLEFTPPGVSKGSALQLLCDRLGIPLEQSIAVGDAENDLDILRTAGLGIAMGNAFEIVKQTAKVTVRSNDEDGCAQAIGEYLLKE